MKPYVPKIAASLVSIGLVLTFAIAGGVLGDNTPYPFYFLVLSYGIGGLILGYVWPKMSWRLGFWLFVIWPPMLLLGLFLGGESLSWANWKANLLDVLSFFWILFVGRVGGWLGAVVGRRFKNTAPTQSATHNHS
jgi:hypothetical protein